MFGKAIFIQQVCRRDAGDIGHSSTCQCLNTESHSDRQQDDDWGFRPQLLDGSLGRHLELEDICLVSLQ